MGYAPRTHLAALGIVQSRKRPCELGDNAFIESFFHAMQDDARHGHVFGNDHALRVAASHSSRRDTRLHSSLGYRAPSDYERSVA